MWANPATATFDDFYDDNAAVARLIVERAISDWNAVITDFNYAEDNDANPNNDLNNTFSLSVVAEELDAGTRGQVNFADVDYNVDGAPTSAIVRIDDNGGGAGWFFDSTPPDDAEFTAIAAPFSASFIDINGQARRDDLYRTVVHEIGHALGITSDPNSAISGMLTNLVNQNGAAVRAYGNPLQEQLRRFESTRPAPTFGVSATFVGGHIYEGDIYDGANSDPVTVFEQGNLAVPIAFQAHPNELLNPGISVPAGNPNPPPPNETVRQWITDLDAMILADAYGYIVTLPSNVVVDPDIDPRNALHTTSAHTIFDSQAGTLLVQGLPNNPANETFGFAVEGDEIVVSVSYGVIDYVSRFKLDSVSQIVIARNGGNDTVTVATALQPLVREVQFVVSTNQDNATTGDLSAVIPGNQTSLRGSIIAANAAGAARSIFVPRGNYQLTLSGTSDSDLINDLDVTSDITIIGTGAGASVIDGSGISPGVVRFDDRLFHVNGATAALHLSRMTLTGANTSGTGGAIFSQDNSRLELDQVAIVGNSLENVANPQTGGGIRSGPGSTLVVRNSVITGNSTNASGGAIYADGASITIANTIFANNQGTRKNIGRPVSTSLINQGNNISDEQPNFNAAAPYFDVILGAAPQFVVTSIIDTNRATYDPATLSVREAIMQANTASNVDTILLPAWNFGLTIARRDRMTFPTDTLAQYGDLDVEYSVSIRGINGGANNRTAIGWRAGITDKAFELLGDYNNDGEADYGSVSSADYSIWASTLGSTTDLRADGDDDGTVNQGDYNIWFNHFSRTMSIANVLVT